MSAHLADSLRVCAERCRLFGSRCSEEGLGSDLQQLAATMIQAAADIDAMVTETALSNELTPSG